VLLGGAGGVGWAGGGATSLRRSADPLQPDDNVKDLAIPAFTLRDQDGKGIDNSVFTGHVTIVDFFFTHCRLVCPVLTQHMADQQRTLKGTDVRMLSISVDPEHDTPEVIKAYAAEHGADPGRWAFASGDRQTIGKIVEGGFKFAVGDDPNPDRMIDLAGGKKMNNIVHPSWFVLVGPKGEVLGIYLAEMEEDMEALTARARVASARLR
jgi:protein SCO1/2